LHECAPDAGVEGWKSPGSSFRAMTIATSVSTDRRPRSPLDLLKLPYEELVIPMKFTVSCAAHLLRVDEATASFFARTSAADDKYQA